ncbi:MAG: histidine kinase [Cyanothece sp. SIO1E1]|nr:histidine kinase [Cyanothece sp. SIO1E1]
MSTPCHIIVEGNPSIIYTSRNGSPEKVLRVLKPFLKTFLQERETCGEYSDTPECLVAQILVRIGFESCEDDFSNLKIGVTYYPDVKYLYQIAADGTIKIWTPTATYQSNPSLGIQGCAKFLDTIQPLTM